jgi:hypothetical protein
MPYGNGGYRGRFMGRRGRRGGAYRRRGAGYSRNVGYYGRYKSAMGMIPTSVQWGGELKFADLSLGAGLATDTYSMFDTGAGAFTLAAGTGESGRIGRKVLLKSINLQFKVYTPEAVLATFTNQEDAHYRVMVVLDKQANGAKAAYTDILDTSVIADPTKAYNNLANKNRFVTLMDKKFQWVPNLFDNAGAANYQSKQMNFNLRKKFNNLPVEYSGTTGAVAELASTNIVVVFAEISTSSARLTPTAEVDGRVRFIDG